MKIIDLKMYGTELKTFYGTVEGYDINQPNNIIKSEFLTMLQNIIKAFGYENEKITEINNIEIIKFERCDDENFILFCINVNL